MSGDHGGQMRGKSFKQLLNWALEEYRQSASVFGIPAEKFHRTQSSQCWPIFREKLGTPIGPAAGPHTQLAQNIVSAYLCGARYFELKTVQVLDNLEFPKPCIWAEDEGYNTEWSTELSLREAHAEYVKAWFLIQVLQQELFGSSERDFMFNMSIGYDLEGIKSRPVDDFLDGMKDASDTEVFRECQTVLEEENLKFKRFDRQFLDNISPCLCSSVTLSTMHGCPPKEIEAICEYLLGQKKLHTLVKMNPTLLGYDFVRTTFDRLGYDYITLKEESFLHDLQYQEGVEMLRRLKRFSAEHDLDFGIKLANTLPVQILHGELPGNEMYLSGRALYPLTINLAYRLAAEFDGEIAISYSGGADALNIVSLISAGIVPVTAATTLLKPGGYQRLTQIAQTAAGSSRPGAWSRLDLGKLKDLAEQALTDSNYRKEKRLCQSRKLATVLPVTDCYIAPCTAGCPIEQDIPAYIRLSGQGRQEEALAVIMAQNPLPFITGTICTHPCSMKCTRLDYDEPVRIRELKLQVAKRGYQGYVQKIGNAGNKPVTGKKAAIIGAGPSGLAAGYYLARAGFEVTVFDKRDMPGGTVQHVIPEFRIAGGAIACDLDLVQRMGVNFELGVDAKFSLDELQKRGFAYIYIAIGAGQSKALNLGDDGNVWHAVSFLEEYKKREVDLGKRVAVIGGGNTAVDAARAALRLPQVEEVQLIYRRSVRLMPADREELQVALAEGVKLRELLLPVEVRGKVLKCQRMTLGESDYTGRCQAIALAGQYAELQVDAVILAIGEKIETELLLNNGLECDEEGRPILTDLLETNIRNVFIGGDARRGPSTVVQSMADAMLVAKTIMERENLDWKDTLPYLPSADEEQRSTGGRITAISERKGVLQAAGNLEVEFERCLECNYVCNICVEVCPNRANVAIEVAKDNFKTLNLTNINQIIHLDVLCNECGNCATFCPHSGAPYREKPTLFTTLADFENSTNPGFVLVEAGEKPVFRVRHRGGIQEVRFDREGRFDTPIGSEMASLVWAVSQNYSFLF